MGTYIINITRNTGNNPCQIEKDEDRDRMDSINHNDPKKADMFNPNQTNPLMLTGSHVRGMIKNTNTGGYK